MVIPNEDAASLSCREPSPFPQRVEHIHMGKDCSYGTKRILHPVYGNGSTDRSDVNATKSYISNGTRSTTFALPGCFKRIPLSNDGIRWSCSESQKRLQHLPNGFPGGQGNVLSPQREIVFWYNENKKSYKFPRKNYHHSISVRPPAVIELIGEFESITQ